MGPLTPGVNEEREAERNDMELNNCAEKPEIGLWFRWKLKISGP